MRGNITHVGTVGAIGTDQIARRWSVIAAMYCFGSSANGAARTPGAPAPVLPYVRADGSIGLNRVFAGARNSSGPVMKPFSVSREGGFGGPGVQRTLAASFGNLHSPATASGGE